MKIGIVAADKELEKLLQAEINASGHTAFSAGRLSTLLSKRLPLVFAQWPINDALPEFLESLEASTAENSVVPVVVLVPQGAFALVHRAKSVGAVDVLFYPADPEELRAEIADIGAGEHDFDAGFQERYRKLLRTTLVGEASNFRRCLEDLKLAAKCDANVLIVGETGTGKEMFTQAIHHLSRRAGNALIAINCASLPGTLLEAELFGHAKGAFTGAETVRHGRFEAVGAGTLLLDEIGDIEPALQMKLLRVIEQRVFQRLGENKDVPFNARLISATSADLESAVDSGHFRRDLLGRIDQFRIVLPPLRERRADIPILARHFLRKHRKGRDIEISKTSMELLESIDYPMNIRQLENTIVGALARSDPGTLILPRHLPKGIGEPRGIKTTQSLRTFEIPSSLSYKEARNFATQAVDDLFLGDLLRKHNGNQTRAAEEAGVDRKTFSERLEQLRRNEGDHGNG